MIHIYTVWQLAQTQNERIKNLIFWVATVHFTNRLIKLDFKKSGCIVKTHKF